MRYSTLSADENSRFSSTLSDLRTMHVAMVALVRGNANAVEQKALADLAKPGKTKYLDEKERGIMAVQSALDRAQFYFAKALGDVASRFDFEIGEEMVPRDACVSARNGRTADDNAEKIKALWRNDWGIINATKTIWLLLKAKYSAEQLANAGSLEIEKKKRTTNAQKQRSEFAVWTGLMKRFPGDTATVAAELAKFQADPVNYKIPEVTSPVEVAQQTLSAAV